MRLHKKVWLWWGRWWAVQFTNEWFEIAPGIRVNFKRPMVDIYTGPLTIAFGRHAVYTDPRTRTWDSCRGMIFPDHHKFPLSKEETEKLFGKSVEEARVL